MKKAKCPECRRFRLVYKTGGLFRLRHHHSPWPWQEFLVDRRQNPLCDASGRTVSGDQVLSV